MKILYNNKVYEATREKDARLMIVVNKKKVFAGFGFNNMNHGFDLVPESAPVEVGDAQEAD